MRLFLIAISIVSFSLMGCSTNNMLKSVQYKKMYNQKPVSLLVMPPINRSMNVEAKEFFHSTLSIPLAEHGYYVIPSFLSMDIMKKESAYDAELFIDRPLGKFQEIFGADAVLFTIIHKWKKSALAANIKVEIEYIMKSTKTGEVLFSKHGQINYNTSVSSGGAGVFGALVNLTATLINTAATKHIQVGRVCNIYSMNDLPSGKYSPKYNIDGQEIAGKSKFKKNLNSNNYNK